MAGFVICGVEHSGTTLISDLFRQAPHVDSGFELGVMLAPTPRRFPEVASHFPYFASGWGLTEADAQYVCDTDDLPTFYARLQARDVLLKPGTQIIFDKTPRYLAILDQCLARLAAPFIVTWKDPRAIAWSNFQRSGEADFSAWFGREGPKVLAYLRGLYDQHARARAQANGRVLFMPLEHLCLRAGASCEALFAHAGVPFDPGYLILENLRYPNTKTNSIAAGLPFVYRRHLNHAGRHAIERDWAALADWFHD
jgi:hypothetical protein